MTARDRVGKETVVSYNATTFYDRDRRLQGVFAAARDITERKQAEEEILKLALYDSLTQLPNRHLLTERLRQTMVFNKRNGCCGALMFLDLDNFKALNDTHGHHVGDLLLFEVARRIDSSVRETDTVARFGGDEFVVLLNALDKNKTEATTQAGIVAEKIHVALSSPYVLKVAHEGGGEKTTIEHHCTVSIGVVVFPYKTGSHEDIMKWADTAMYKAKDSGRNLIRFYDQEA